ncbi:MAG: flavin reductase family protein [Flaviflexus sp.]|nr:flavin reductase family protein [Flaviflexus sp.]
MIDRFLEQLSGRSRALKVPRPTDEERLRSAFGKFATGVCTVTYEHEGTPRGITVNSFTSVSLAPPLILISLHERTAAHDLLDESTPFTVNVLDAGQQDVAVHFAGRPHLDIGWTAGKLAPRLTRSLAYFECTPWNKYPAGDHSLLIGEVQDFGYVRGDALGFNGSAFTQIAERILGLEHLL